MKFRSKLVWCVRSPIAAFPKENKDRKWISGKDSAAAEHQSSIIGQMKTEQPSKRQTNKQLVRINGEKNIICSSRYLTSVSFTGDSRKKIFDYPLILKFTPLLYVIFSGLF